ncbi:hypothetical protein RHSIM_RhsimUnG0137000 [Rhododendron simsii]|uniref:Uncharacterized protein n=1 Tax=Rhododendron simsii TaxID=118357 RepID=A0A834FV51_RHOSS|nr:hypothetical protein RHSIM_RhsimUnG0137000 [Rhododendron simsii]
MIFPLPLEQQVTLSGIEHFPANFFSKNSNFLHWYIPTVSIQVLLPAHAVEEIHVLDDKEFQLKTLNDSEAYHLAAIVFHRPLTLLSSIALAAAALVSTKSFGVINQGINLEAYGRVYPIRAVEEQVVVNNLIGGICKCKCKGRDSLITKNRVFDKDDVWANEKIAEDNHLVDVESLQRGFEGGCDQDDHKPCSTSQFLDPISTFYLLINKAHATLSDLTSTTELAKMAHILDFAWTKLKEAFCWCISKTKKFFDKFTKETENSTNHAEKFPDNFSREFKESLLKSKTVINTVIKRVTSTTSTPMSSFFCSAQKLNLGLLETSVSSVVEKLKNHLAYLKKFMNLTSEAANKIGQRFSIDICYDDEKLQALIGLAVEIVGLVRSVKLKAERSIPSVHFKTKFFQNLPEDTENSMNQAKKLSDNFSQKFSEPFLKSKPMIDTIIEQVTSIPH